MIGFILNQNVFVYVITAIGMCGIAARMILSGYLGGLVKATENIGTTKKKFLSGIRKRYEELSSLNMEIRDTRSFVGRYIGKLKLWKISVNSWNNFIKNLVILSAGTGIIGGYAIYRTTGVYAAGIETALYGAAISCLIVIVSNIFDSRAALDNLTYEIENYLHNSLANRLKRESIKKYEPEMKIERNVIDIDKALEEKEIPRRKREKKKEGDMTREQIAACDALFDKLIEDMVPTLQS